MTLFLYGWGVEGPRRPEWWRASMRFVAFHADPWQRHRRDAEARIRASRTRRLRDRL